MNEKIKEFAEQAWPGLPSHWWDRRDGEVAEAVNKFAELIVQECCQALSPMLRDQISRGHAVDLIKKHFEE